MEPLLDGAEGEEAAGGEEHLEAGNGSRESVNGVDNCVPHTRWCLGRSALGWERERHLREGGGSTT